MDLEGSLSIVKEMKGESCKHNSITPVLFSVVPVILSSPKFIMVNSSKINSSNLM